MFHMSDVACVRSWKDEMWGPIHKRLLTMCVAREHNGWKRKTGMTQNQKIVRHIMQHGSISQRDAYLDYGIQSFHRRLTELKDSGYDIVRTAKKHPVTKQDYSRYSLRETVVTA